MSTSDFDVEDFLPYLLNQAAEAASRSFQRVYKERYGMLRAEWRVMFHLGRYGTLTARDISDRAGLHKTKVSRAVSALERRRFVYRETNNADRREAWLNLTSQGQAAYADLRQVAQAHDTRLVSTMSKQQAAQLRATLRTLAAPMKHAPKK